MLTFRNVEVSPDDPVETWPAEAIATALVRGDLGHWRRLADAIQVDPWGPVARAVESVVEMDAPYGVSLLMRDVIAGARRDAVASVIRRMVAESGLSLRECAARVGTSGARLSTYARGHVVPRADFLFRLAGVSGHQIGIVARADQRSRPGAVAART
ncbi:MAG: helix-turn-helix domain-containing protein [Acidimicrobiales bacterium]